MTAGAVDGSVQKRADSLTASAGAGRFGQTGRSHKGTWFHGCWLLLQLHGGVVHQNFRRKPMIKQVVNPDLHFFRDPELFVPDPARIIKR